MTIDMDSFLNDALTGDKLATERKPLPLGDYLASIGPEDKDISFNSGTRNDGSAWVSMNINYVIEDYLTGRLDEEFQGRPLRARQSIWLNLDQNEEFDFHNNQKLGHVCKAAGFETDASGNVDLSSRSLVEIAQELRGKNGLVVRLKHRTTEEGAVYEEVSRVTAR